MKFKAHISFAVLLFVLSTASALSQGASSLRSREDFVAVMSKITNNMPKEAVLALLGKPDDIRTRFDPGGINAKEIWCYGTKEHMGFPTLGCVYINSNDEVSESFGGKGHPPQPGMFKEEELRDFLRLLDTGPVLNSISYDPLPVIRIVNTLQPLGKEKALAVIGEYLRLSDEWSLASPRDGLFLVLRALFDLPGDIDPGRAGGFGAPSPPGPKDPQLIPTFPIVVVDGIPLMLIRGYTLGGVPTPMEQVLEFYRDHGQLRSKPLLPADDPLAALAHLTNSRQWIYANTNLQYIDYFSSVEPDTDEREKAMLMEELLKLIDSVYRLPADVLNDRLPCGEPPEPAWRKIVSDVSAKKIRWDPQQNLYVFPDGSHLPMPKKKIYQRAIWQLNDLGFYDAELILERKRDVWLDIDVYSSSKIGADLKPATLTLFDTDNDRTPLATFVFTDTKGKGDASFRGQTMALKTGTKIQAILTINGYKTNSSPVFIP